MKKDYSFLNDNAKSIATQLINHFNVDKDSIKSSTKNRIIYLTDTPRAKIFKIFESLGFTKDSSIPGSSIGGYITSNGVEIITKPKSGQGSNSSGKINESSFIDLINKSIESSKSPITIILKNNKKEIKYEQVSKCIDASVNGSFQFYKADAQFLDSDSNIIANISLKKRNAIRWESSKTRKIEGIDVFKSFYNKAIQNEFPNISLTSINPQKKKYKLHNPILDKNLSKVVIINTPPEIIKDVVFGIDFPQTIVVKEDFEEFTTYNLTGSTLTIECHLIYDDVNDILNTPDEPVFSFSNHVGQTYGIEFRSFSKGLLFDGDKLRGSSEIIDFDQLR